MTKTWVVVQTKGRKEAWAAKNIERQGLEYYLPYIIPEKDDKEGVLKCLFPGYVFVSITGQWRFLLNTFGVSRLIMNGEHPAILPKLEIEKLRARENSDGYIELPKYSEHRSSLMKGDVVHVLTGPLQGLDGICAESSQHERVQVLFEILGRKTRVQLARAQLLRTAKA